MNPLNIPPRGANYVNRGDTPRLVMQLRGAGNTGSAGVRKGLDSTQPGSHSLPWGAEFMMKTGEVGNKPWPLKEDHTYI